MGQTCIKICGITNEKDAINAIEQGADALGFNLYEGSARRVGLKKLEAFMPGLPAAVKKVAIFVNEDAETVKKVLARLPFDLLQFHGDESAGYCGQFDLPYIKAVRATSAEDITKCAAEHPDAAYLLLDTDTAGQFGGTGKTFDWSTVPNLDTPFLLAGGLTPDNVADAIRQVKPFGVDVAGGVERAKGQKDHNKVAAFIEAVRTVENE